MSHPRLCSPCQAIFSDSITALDEQSPRDHYIDGAAFIATAEISHCYFCTWIWREHQRSLTSGSYEYRPVHSTSYRLHRGKENILDLVFLVRVEEHGQEEIHLFVGRRNNLGGE